MIMKSKIAVSLSLLLCLSLAAPAAFAQDTGKDAEQKDKKKDKKKGSDEGAPDPKKAEKDITKLMRELQFDLEGGSSRSFLGMLNKAKFDDYPRFEDGVERLMRENALRVNFRTA